MHGGDLLRTGFYRAAELAFVFAEPFSIGGARIGAAVARDKHQPYIPGKGKAGTANHATGESLITDERCPNGIRQQLKLEPGNRGSGAGRQRREHQRKDSTRGPICLNAPHSRPTVRTPDSNESLHRVCQLATHRAIRTPKQERP